MSQIPVSNPWQLLIADQKKPFMRKVKNHLTSLSMGPVQEKYQVEVATDLSSAMTLMASKEYDLILVDPDLPDPQKSLELLERVHNTDPDTAIVLLTETDSADWFTSAAHLNIRGILHKSALHPALTCQVVKFAMIKARHEKKRQTEERKYKAIIENLKDAYYETDLKGFYTYMNAAAVKHFDRPMEELIGASHTLTTPRHYHDDIMEKFSRMFKERKESLVEDLELVRPDGSRFFVEIGVSFLKDKQGRITGFCGISRDVTEKKLAQSALMKSEEKYRNILTSIEDGYFEVDLHGQLQFFNDAMAATVLGYPRDELIKANYHEYMDHKNVKKVFQAYNEVFQTGRSRNGLQYEILKKDGTRSTVESSVSLIVDQDNNKTGFRGIARDITRRKQFELELKQAKKDAEQASQAKSEFLANMSHEIRTPMNGVLGMYNLLFGTELTDEQTDYVETGKRSAEALLTVINDILDFSKIEAGKLDIEIIEFDLRKALEEIVTLPAVQAHSKGLEFAYEINHDVPSLLKGDPGRIRQIITNLCTNAIKFTHEGEVVFRAVLEEENETHAKLCFSIQDTGIGISPKDQKRLFSSFEQVDASTTRKYGGTGLGLAISKNLAELMGGNIGLESQLGEGATFWFTSVFEKQQNVEQTPFEDIESIQGKRILIVDDNQTNLDILSGYLHHWECSCDTALSGEMALSLMRAVVKAKAPYDLVISDMLMPRMDGAELGTIIKNDPELQSTQLVMLTSRGLRGDAAQMKKIGFDAYLNKPVRRSLLYDCLVSVINRKDDTAITHPKTRLVTSYSISEEKKSKLRILLAEDNMVNQKVALSLLKKFGLKVDPVTNGRLAVHALEQTDYDLVLMDVQMPEMDGLSATKMIRDPESGVINHDVLIIAMTAHAMKGDRDMCLKAGMDDYISKPIKPKKLLEIIEKNIEKIQS